MQPAPPKEAEDGEETKPGPVSLPYGIAPKMPPGLIPSAFDVEDVYDGQGKRWKMLVVSTPAGVAWYFLQDNVAEQLAKWLGGDEPGPASKLIIPGVHVQPDMFKSRPGG